MSTDEMERTLLRIEEQLRALAREVKRSTVPQVALTVAQAGRALNRSRSIIWELIRDGELRTIQIRRTRMVPMSEVLRLGSLPDTPQDAPVIVRSSVARMQENVRAALRKKKP